MIRLAGWVRVAFLTWLIAGCAATAAQGGTGAPRDACRPLDYGYGAENARSARDEVVVPVIIHLMGADVPPPPGWHQPQDVWQRAAVEKFFGSSAAPGLVNDLVWGRVHVRVAVIRVETCRYSPAVFRRDADHKGKASVPNPDEGPEAAALYHRINAAYNAYDERGNRALDVYFWVKVGEASSASAYGTSLKRQTAAVWADAFCAMTEAMQPETCALKLAHEIGHALSLPHVCKNTGISPNHPDAGLAVECGTVAESPESRVNLMRAVQQGDSLTEAQVAQARGWAREHYGLRFSD